MRSVFKYTNYRQYLQDYYESRKKKEKISYREMAENGGMKSNSYLIEVIDGIKNLSLKKTFALASSMGLVGEEISYFSSLVGHNDAREKLERKHYREMLKYQKEKV